VTAPEARLSKRITDLHAEMQAGFANLETRFALKTRSALFETRLEQRIGSQMKWMFAFWLGTLLPLAGLMIALQRWGG